MTTTRSLIAGVALAIVLAAIAPILGDNGGAGYAETVQPLLLFAASAAALFVALTYRLQMRILFLSLACFAFFFRHVVSNAY